MTTLSNTSTATHTATHRAITILGAGHIGFAMALLLQQAGDYDILVVDRDPARLAEVAALGVSTQLATDDASLQTAIDGRFAVLNALPFHRAVPVATLCAAVGVHYFDLTEDVASTQAIRALAALLPPMRAVVGCRYGCDPDDNRNVCEECAVLRATGKQTPVMILSGTSEIETKVKTFGGGADDYMTKPFHKDELIARTHAVVRRSKGHAQAIIHTGEIAVNLDGKTVEVAAGDWPGFRGRTRPSTAGGCMPWVASASSCRTVRR